MPDDKIQYIFANLLDPPPDPLRTSHDPEKLARMAETIKVCGIEQPIRVFANGDRFTIVVGERRWRGSVLAGLELVPCIVEEGYQSAARLRIRRLLENTAREALTPLELAAAVDTAITIDGFTPGEVASQIGCSATQVSRLRSIHNRLTDEQKEDVRQGKLGFKAAYELVAGGRNSADAKLARKIRRVQREDRRPRQKVTLPVAKGCSVAVLAPKMSLDSLAAWFATLAERARDALQHGVSIEQFAKSLRKPALAESAVRP